MNIEMNTFIATILCIFYLQFLPTLKGQQHFVIGGNYVDISDAPYMLSLRRLGHHICGATVISNYWTVSAAHCVLKSFPSQITLRGGNRSRFLGGLFQAQQIVLHPEFDIQFHYDIAVIRTFESLIQSDNSIRALELGLQSTISPPNSFAQFTGWGITEASNVDLSEFLKTATVQFINNNECNATLIEYGGTTDRYYGSFHRNMENFPRFLNYCTIGVAFQDFCLGDEGGPLVQDDRLVGIASWSPQCGGNMPSVFTRVTTQRIRSFIFTVTGN